MRFFFSIVTAFIALTHGAYAGQIWLTMDQVRPLKLETPAKSVVIGNPSIADVVVQDSTNLLLFGKAPGLTNIYFFNDAGEAVENLIIRVRTPSSDMLTFHRGTARTTYNCTTNCEATITVGDDQTVFGGVSTQVRNKLRMAKGGGRGNSGNEGEGQ